MEISITEVYSQFMPTVYRTETNRSRYRFHRSKDCKQLTKASRSGRKAEVIAVELSDLDRAVPCMTCYSDSPKLASAHRYCTRCNKGTARPCAHNGGVPVYITKTRRKHMLFSEPGDTYAKRMFVWPEKAHLFLR